MLQFELPIVLCHSLFYHKVHRRRTPAIEAYQSIDCSGKQAPAKLISPQRKHETCTVHLQWQAAMFSMGRWTGSLLDEHIHRMHAQ